MPDPTESGSKNRAGPWESMLLARVRVTSPDVQAAITHKRVSEENLGRPFQRQAQT